MKVTIMWEENIIHRILNKCYSSSQINNVSKKRKEKEVKLITISFASLNIFFIAT